MRTRSSYSVVMVRSRGAGVVALLGVLLFWAGVFTAGALLDGYSAVEDYISSLAGRGSPVAVLGVAAFLASTTAHLATSFLVLTVWRSRLAAGSVLLAGVAVAAVAVFRTSCPRGPAGCGVTDTSAGDWVDTVHGLSVGAYQLFTMAAMLTLAVGSLRGLETWPRWLGLTSLAFAIASMILVSQLAGEMVGLWQRLWVATNLTWLLVAAWAATRHDPAGLRPGHG